MPAASSFALTTRRQLGHRAARRTSSPETLDEHTSFALTARRKSEYRLPRVRRCTPAFVGRRHGRLDEHVDVRHFRAVRVDELLLVRRGTGHHESVETYVMRRASSTRRIVAASAVRVRCPASLRTSDSGQRRAVRGSETGEAPLSRGFFRSRPVSRILSRVTISLCGVPGSSAGRVNGACFTLHRTGFG